MKYPKVLNLHKLNIFCDTNWKEIEWIIQEKIDGSQFRVWIENSKVNFGSKSIDNNYEKMFLPAIRYIKSIEEKLKQFEGYTFFFEYLKKPKHNSLAYQRTPKNHLILFDIFNGKDFEKNKIKYADIIEVEAIKEFETSKVTLEYLKELVKSNQSMLGGIIEGIVLKNYDIVRNRDPYFGMPLFVKHVRDEFKELNRETWKKEGKKDILDKIEEKYKTTARWHKAIQHLKENGELEFELRDLAKLPKEIIIDTFNEEKENIKNDLWDFYKKDIKKRLIKGFPDWYKDYLIKEKGDLNSKKS